MIEAGYNYRGFIYQHEENSPYVLMFDGKPMTKFENYDLLTNFVDNVTNMVEQIPWFKDFKLHLTGCKRCAKTANGQTFNPCETGKPKFINAKNIIAHVCGEMIDAIEEAHKVTTPAPVE